MDLCKHEREKTVSNVKLMDRVKAASFVMSYAYVIQTLMGKYDPQISEDNVVAFIANRKIKLLFVAY